MHHYQHMNPTKHVEIALKVTLKEHVPFNECVLKDPTFCTSAQISAIHVVVVAWNHKLS